MVDVIAIVGPTATGKSQLALRLAERLAVPVEIVNADAFAQYRGMDIGTAKPSAADQQRVRHHMVDVLDPAEPATIAGYQQAARAAIDEIIGRGATPIVVGGSGLYLHALLDQLAIPPADPVVRAGLEAKLELVGPAALHLELARLDPAAAASIDPRNARRVVRALEAVTITGRPFQARLSRGPFWRTTIMLGLTLPRAEIAERVAQRVAVMRDAGLLAEVQGLASLAQCGTNPGQGLGETAARAIGYAELLPVLRGEADEATAFDAITTHTRQLVRKQRTWFNRDPRITWLDATSPSLLDDAYSSLRA